MRALCLVRSVYQVSEEEPAEDEEGEDNVPSYREWELPSASFHTVRSRDVAALADADPMARLQSLSQQGI